MRQLHQDAGAVTRSRIAAAGAAMGQVVQHTQALLDDLVGLLAFDICYEANAAGVVLERWIV